jgi:hypothetical protein
MIVWIVLNIPTTNMPTHPKRMIMTSKLAKKIWTMLMKGMSKFAHNETSII